MIQQSALLELIV